MTALIKDSLKVIILSTVVSLSVFLVLAQGGWVEPSVAPPGGNVDAPLNTGSTGQSKSGGLILNTGGAANGLIVSGGNVGIGTTSPSKRLDIVGDLNLTGDLYTSGTKSLVFGGLYYTQGSSPGGACLDANPATGSCSCPSGFTVSYHGIFKPSCVNCGWSAGYTVLVPGGVVYELINQCWK